MKIIILMAVSVDGIIGKDSKHTATDWTTAADKKAFIAETKKHGVIIMGDTTFETIGRPLPGRLNLILSLTPEKYQEKVKPDVLEFIKGQPQEIIDHLKSRGFESAILGGGARTNAGFLKAGLVDEIVINVQPKVFGAGLNFTEGQDLDIDLELVEVTNIGDSTVQLRYKILK